MELDYALQQYESRLHVTVHYFSYYAFVKTNQDCISTTIKIQVFRELVILVYLPAIVTRPSGERSWSSLYALI